MPSVSPGGEGTRRGGLFGAYPQTGSIGVVTINMSRIGFLAADEHDVYQRLDQLMEVARTSLETKRKVLEQFTDNDLYPYTKFYLRHIKEGRGRYWHNHFGTVGLVGLNVGPKQRSTPVLLVTCVRSNSGTRASRRNSPYGRSTG